MKSLSVVLGFSLLVPAGAQAQTPLVGLGDSLGEGVQSGDANEYTQPFSYLALMAQQIGVPFPLPLIWTSPIGVVGSVIGRDRMRPLQAGANLAVSGTDVTSILQEKSDAVRNSETDLVLWPRIGSQMDVAEKMKPGAVVCWVGNNDVLAAALHFDHLDASQLTSVAEFSASYRQLATRLQALGKPVVVGTIPNVTRIAFLLDNTELTRFTGVNYNLPAGHYTSFVAGILLRLRLAGSELLQDSNWVLDPAEVQKIQARIGELNFIIVAEAHARGFAVAPVNSMFELLALRPPVLAGVTLNIGVLGGLFSLDGIHPSNTAHALLANLFLDSLNKHYGASLPLLPLATLNVVAARDPFVDLNRNGRVRGRPFAGLFETLAPSLGLSGDEEASSAGPAAVDRGDPGRFLTEYRRLTGRAVMANTRTEVISALRHILGLGIFGVY
jgi:lysophospholipase L1-like esterase